jgi:hypothetical protein
MKKVILALALATTLFSCKKDTCKCGTVIEIVNLQNDSNKVWLRNTCEPQIFGYYYTTDTVDVETIVCENIEWW